MNKTFIDLFAGCGGLSLGLIKAGWTGLFAIEKTPDAFETLKHNLIEKKVISSFKWPEWLPCSCMTTSDLLKNHSKELENLKGKVDLIAGGPPCQGFSFAGRRNPKDPRNRLTEEYIEIVKIIRPKFLLLENVKGFKAPFKQSITQKETVYSEIVKNKLESLNYTVKHKMLDASKFGVPQPRSRFIMIAYNNKITNDPFEVLEQEIENYLITKGLPTNRPVSVKEAISDLETKGKNLIPCEDSNGFMQIKYTPKKLTKYQELMRVMVEKNISPNSLRLPKHKEDTLHRFKIILDNCTKGKSVSREELNKLGTKKQCFTPLHPDRPSRTITTLPDDLLHYSEARILTVRENARIQSFPDWFEFKGKYTTGGARRKEECPRYTQVGNAVPPLMAEALGLLIKNIY